MSYGAGISKLLACWLLAAGQAQAGGIATDGTVGGPGYLHHPQTLTGGDINIPEALGTTRGANLFQSFSRFSIDRGQTVTFQGGPALKNIISRVTGGDVSSIDGTLKSAAPHADFYLINPQGVVFGQHAQIDVPAAFHAGTADELRFKDGARYSASHPVASTLTAAAPAAFGFLGSTPVNNSLYDLQVQGARLQAKAGQALDLSGRGIQIEQAALAAEAGEVRLQAVGAEAAEVPVSKASPSALAGAIHIDASQITANGGGAGRLALRGGDVGVANDSRLSANNTGFQDAAKGKGIDIKAGNLTIASGVLEANAKRSGDAGGLKVSVANRLEMLDGGKILSAAASSADAGDIRVRARALMIDGRGEQTGIASRTRPGSTGQAGDVQVISAEALTVLNGGEIASIADNRGDAGHVLVEAGRLTLDGRYARPDVNTGIASVTQGDGCGSRCGKSGDVRVVVAGDMVVRNSGEVSVDTFNSGNAGSVMVRVGTLDIDGRYGGSGAQTGIVGRAQGSACGSACGNAGQVRIRVDGNLVVRHGGEVAVSTVNSGDAGSIDLQAGGLTVDGRYGPSKTTTGIGSRSLGTDCGDACGDAGDVRVAVAGNLAVRDNGLIGASTFNSGNAGTVEVRAGSLTVDGRHGSAAIPTGIGSRTQGAGCGEACGDAGDVRVNVAGEMAVRNNGVVGASTYNSGNAGIVDVRAGRLTIDGRGSSDTLTGIISRTLGADCGAACGAAGNVNVAVVGEMAVRNGGTVDVSTTTSGRAGNLSVSARAIRVEGGGEISAAAWAGSSGQTGDLSVSAKAFLAVRDGGEISIQNQGVLGRPEAVHPGSLTVSAPAMLLSNGQITSRSTGNLAAGKVEVGFLRSLCLASPDPAQPPAAITTQSQDGDGGPISVQGGQLIRLSGAQITTSANSGASNGGDIAITASSLVMETGLIQANAQGGNGGNITLTVGNLVPSGEELILGGAVPITHWNPGVFGYNIIQAASQARASGTINSTAPQLNLSGSLANLGGPQFDTQAIRSDFCGLGQGSSLTRKGRGRLEPRGKGLPL